jgi:hypothetical protein
MDKSLSEKLLEALAKIDRPGSFCVHGSAPALLPGLRVKDFGPIGLPLGAQQAQELKQVCEQAPYGKGTETLVDTSVRNVWRLAPDRFALANPEWDKFVGGIVAQVREELGLKKQKLQAHLYDLLLYEPGGFFLPHQDGEKLERMVATLVIVLPSEHEGGELVVRHEGREEIVDFTTGSNPFEIHFAAFYADCEHEIRPLRQGYRLCLVYNLTLVQGKKGMEAPRASEHVAAVAGLLSQWAKDPLARKLAITLEHQYTEKGLAWDTLKGVDRAVATVLNEAAHRAGCKTYLALLTLWESGSAEEPDYDDRYRRRDRWRDEEEEDEDDDEAEDRTEGKYEMLDVDDSSLTAKNAKDKDGNEPPIAELSVDEEELLNPDALRAVKPEEEFEGYTGNAGMTLERWYRHAALVLWPESRTFEILSAESAADAVTLLKKMVAQWRKASKKNAAALQEQCLALATAILAHWRDNPYGAAYGQTPKTDELFGLLAALGAPKLIDAYLGELMLKDLALDPGTALVKYGQQVGWPTLQRPLVAIFKTTTAPSLPRNLRVLEHIASAQDRGAGWRELCEELAHEVVAALERIDLSTETDWRLRHLNRAAILPGVVRALVASNQAALLARVVAHALAHPDKYPLLEVHLGALAGLQDWLKKNVKARNVGLSQWLAACRAQLEALTAQLPQKPRDFRRPAPVTCRCKLCQELNRYLADPKEEGHRFMAPQHDRSHLEHAISQHQCDVEIATERTRPSHTLVCTKNTKSYERALKKYHEDQKRLALVRKVEADLPAPS